MGSNQDKPRRMNRIRDARGRKVTQLDPVALHLLRRHDVIEADVLRTIANENGVRITVWERAALIVAVLALVAVCGLFVTELVLGGLTDAPYVKHASVVSYVFMLWMTWCIIRRLRFGHVKAAILKHGRCPHCGYDLEGLPIDGSDGATVCPECGCAWRVSDGATKRRRDESTKARRHEADRSRG